MWGENKLSVIVATNVIDKRSMFSLLGRLMMLDGKTLFSTQNLAFDSLPSAVPVIFMRLNCSLTFLKTRYISESLLRYSWPLTHPACCLTVTGLLSLRPPLHRVWMVGEGVISWPFTWHRVMGQMLVIVKLGSRSEYFTLTVSARVELVTGQGESFSQKLGPGDNV